MRGSETSDGVDEGVSGHLLYNGEKQHGIIQRWSR